MPSPAQAHAIEALTGLGLGGLVGGAVGGMSYSPRAPTEWADEYGLLYNRPLSSKEKQERKQRILKAALLAAGAGAAASVGGGALRRSLLTAAESKAVPSITKERLKGLRKVIHDLKGQTLGGVPWPSAARNIEKGDKLLKEHAEKIQSLAGDAATARRAAPWGGIRLKGGGATPVPHEMLTHEGRVQRHYMDLEKALDLPPMKRTDEVMGESFFRKLLEKTSAASTFADELEGIGSYSPAHAELAVRNHLRKLVRGL